MHVEFLDNLGKFNLNWGNLKFTSKLNKSKSNKIIVKEKSHNLKYFIIKIISQNLYVINGLKYWDFLT